MHSDFFKFGRKLWEAGLIHMTSGNISVRKGTALYITRTGSILGDLHLEDIKQVNLDDTLRDKGASSETPVHRAIYKLIPDARAIIHAHPVYTTVLSFSSQEIIPVDSDSLYIPKVPVLRECPYGEGGTCVAAHFPKLLKDHKIAAICGHGVFTAGKTLEECAGRISMLENSSKILYLLKISGGNNINAPV